MDPRHILRSVAEWGGRAHNTRQPLTRLEIKAGDEEDTEDAEVVLEADGPLDFIEGLVAGQAESDEGRYTNALSNLKRLFEAGPIPRLIDTPKEVRGNVVSWNTEYRDMLNDLTRGIGREVYAEVVATEQARMQTPEEQEGTDEPREVLGRKSHVSNWNAGELRRSRVRAALPDMQQFPPPIRQEKWLHEAGRQVVKELEHVEDEALKQPGDDFEVMMDVIRHRVREIITRTLPISDDDIRGINPRIFSKSELEPVLMLAIRDGLETLPARRKEAMEGTAV